MTLGLEGYLNKPLNVYTRTIAFVSSILLLLPPLSIFYGVSGFLLNGVGLVILIFVYFIQGKIKLGHVK